MTFPVGGGIGLASAVGDAAPRAETYVAHVIDAAANEAWDEYRPRLTEHLEEALGRGDVIYKGVTLYRIGIELSSDLSFTVARAPDGDILVSVTTMTNTITAHATQPTVLGDWADPAFRFTFGLAFTYRLRVPPLTGPITASKFESIRVLGADLQPGNFVADVLFVVNAIWAWLTGDDYLQVFRDFLDKTDFAPYANKALGPVNAELTRLAADGYWFLESLVNRLDGGGGGLRTMSLPGAPTDTLEVLLTARGFDRSGVIEGEITWPAGFGHPTSSAVPVLGALRDADSVSVAAASVLDRQAQVSIGIAPVAPAGVEHGEVLDGADHVRTDRPAFGDGSPLAGALAALAPAAAASAATDLRAAVASRFVDLVGTDAFARLQTEFLLGTDDFVVIARTHVDNDTPFGTDRVVSRMGALWRDDDDTTGRRHYRLVDVATDTPLALTCDLAEGYRFTAHDGRVTGVSAGWQGFVTVHPPAHLADLAKLRVDALSAHASAVDQVALNPQPLPPKEVHDVTHARPDVAVRQAVQRPAAGLEVAQGIGDAVRHGTIRDRAMGGDAVSEALRKKKMSTGAVIHELTDEAKRHHIDQEVINAARQNPSGSGVVVGIDFSVQPDLPPDVR